MTKSKSSKSLRLEPLMFSDPGSDADMKYFTRFSCADPFLAFGSKGKRLAVTHGLEFGRMQAESCLDEVLEWSACMKLVAKSLSKGSKKTTSKKSKTKVAPPSVVDLVRWLQKKYGIQGFQVPRQFPAWLLDQLGAAGVLLHIADGPMFPSREIKTPDEVEMLREANGAAAAGHRATVKALRASTIGANGILRLDGKELTSERMRHIINVACLEAGAMNVLEPIAAAGEQGTDCHCVGYGPIHANELIIVDIFPRMISTGYFGDMTRTYLKGVASPEQRKLYRTVKKAHGLAIAEVKAGVSTRKPWKVAMEYFDELGYETTANDGVFTGFFHSLGHGVGLQVHEAPGLSRRKGSKLKSGQVVTIEPGLYYPGLGGVRVEDVVVVTEEGCEMISKAAYTFQIA